jgi:CheY-like chemotaxis protein
MANLPHRGARILLVDDEPDFREVLSFLLIRKGYVVLTAKNGREALEVLHRTPVDAVISDIRMPGGDGIELLEKARQELDATPVILLVTGFSELSTEDAYHKGAEALFSKPFAPSDLEETLDRLLTPPGERWARETERAQTNLKIRLTFEHLTEAVDAHVISMGRGGMFVSIERESLPNVNEKTNFVISPESGAPALSGSGIVRWARCKPAPGLPTGCGIEFLYLPEPERNRILAMVADLKPLAYIPKQ